MSESSCTTLGVCQFRYLDNLCLLVAGNDHLGMPFFRARPLRGLTCAS